MFFIIVGSGLMKPNISNIVGRLYPENDKRIDSGFVIFYMSVNSGAKATIKIGLKDWNQAAGTWK